MKNDLVFSYLYSFDKNRYIFPHSHNELELILYLKADAVSKIDNISYEIENNTIAIINPGITHDEFHREPCNNILIRFNFDTFKLPTGVYHTSQTALIEQLMRKIIKESNYPRFGYKELISAKIEELTILIIREILNNKYNSNNNTDNLHQFYIYLSENYNLNLDLKKASSEFGLEYNSIRNKFKKIYGISPSQLITLKRVQQATILLEGTPMSCTEIAVECGFSDAAHFSKHFKRQYGCSPNEFRKQTHIYIK